MKFLFFMSHASYLEKLRNVTVCISSSLKVSSAALKRALRTGERVAYLRGMRETHPEIVMKPLLARSYENESFRRLRCDLDDVESTPNKDRERLASRSKLNRPFSRGTFRLSTSFPEK